MTHTTRQSHNGFTLVEVMLTTLVLVVILGITLPLYLGFQTRSNLEDELDVTVRALQRAQVLSRALSHDGSWGVKIAVPSITVFQGASFATRDTTLDEVTTLTTTITPTGISEIIFSKLTGEPQTSGAIILTNQNNDQKTITINAKGALAY